MATIGEEVRGKQAAAAAGLATREPTKKELKKAVSTQATATAGVGKFVFRKPDLKPLNLTSLDTALWETSLRELNQFREEIGPYLHDLISALRQIEAMKEDERALAQEDYTAVRAAIERILNDDQPLVRELATIAYADAIFKTCLPSRQAVQDVLHNLVEKGFLEESPVNGGKSQAGVKEIYGKGYSLSGRFSGNPEAKEAKRSSSLKEAKKVFASIDGLVSRSVAAGREYFEVRRDAVTALAGPAESQLLSEDIGAGKLGRRLLSVPRQQWEREGNPYFRKEGGIAIESRQGKKGVEIVALDGFGGIEQDVAKIVGAGVFITPAMLGYDRLVLRDLPEEQFRAIVNLHRLVRLGIAEAERQAEITERKAEFRQQVDAEREALAAKASCTVLDFFVGGAVGTALADWGPKPFLLRHRKDGRPVEKPIWSCFSLVERNERGQIRVADCPERLNEFFAPHRGFVTPDQSYSALGKLGIILRRVKENAQKGATPEERQAAEKTQAEAKTASEAAEAEANQQLAKELAAGSGEEISGADLPKVPVK